MITELTARIEEWARERALDTANPDKQMLFQSTHSCRVRLKHRTAVSISRNFNPRTRVECDLEVLIRSSGVLDISIHALV